MIRSEVRRTFRLVQLYTVDRRLTLLAGLRLQVCSGTCTDPGNLDIILCFGCGEKGASHGFIVRKQALDRSHCRRSPGGLCAWLAAVCRAALFLWLSHGSATFAATLEVVHLGPEAPGDTRFGHYWRLLAQALTITEPDFGPYTLRQAEFPMTERRALGELETGTGSFNIMVHGNVSDYEQRLLPIRFPLDKGLLGYRVFLIRSEKQSQLDTVNSLDDLRRYRIGLGFGWGGVTILRQAGLTVVEGTSYEGLFTSWPSVASTCFPAASWRSERN
jgi:hypothetical protein